MKLYRVDVGPASIGSGEIVGLTRKQADPRLPNIEALPAEQATGDNAPLGGYEPGEERKAYRAITVQQFKVGELIELAAPPARSQAQFLVDVDAEKASADPSRPATQKSERTGGAATPTPGNTLPGPGSLTKDPRFSEGEKKRPRAKRDLHADILTAADFLDANDGEAFTTDGKPQVKALEAVLGYDITAEERDEAWASKGG